MAPKKTKPRRDKKNRAFAAEEGLLLALKERFIEHEVQGIALKKIRGKNSVR